MSKYDEIWGYAEDHHGIVTSAQAKEIGFPAAKLVSLALHGTLIHLGHGVYQVSHHVPGANDHYAAAVALAGKGAFLRGASVLEMLRLIPATPDVVYLGSSNRVRRRLPGYCRLKDRQECRIEMFERIPCQPIAEAISTARMEGMVDIERIEEAIRNAVAENLVSNEQREALEAGK
jgi:hypothetical protein